VEPRAYLDDVKKIKFLPLPGLELRPLVRAARSQLLYRLSYPGPSKCYDMITLIEVNNKRFRNYIISSVACSLHNVFSLGMCRHLVWGKFY
jgi:hypothetical protein